MKIEVTDEQLALLARMGDKKAMDVLLNKYKPFVNGKVHKYYVKGFARDDVLQEGMIGLFNAVMNYQPEKNDSFAAFASMCIRRRMVNMLENANRQKNIPLNTSVSLNDPVDCDGRTIGDTLENRDDGPEEIFLRKEKDRNTKKRLKGALSKFEFEVLDGFLKGKNYKEIADGLKSDKKSVDNALQRIRRKISRMGIE